MSNKEYSPAIQKMVNMDSCPYYRIVEYTGPNFFLAEKVNKLIDKGWMPVGGPFGSGSHWHQAMIYVGMDDLNAKFEKVKDE